MSTFRRVMKTHRAQSGFNRGSRVCNNALFTYTQVRRGFSYLYFKRKVLHDGIHMVPLDITLCPVPPQEQEVSDEELVNNFKD